MRRVVVIVLAVPYLLVMLPIWAARDFAAAFMTGYRKGQP